MPEPAPAPAAPGSEGTPAPQTPPPPAGKVLTDEDLQRLMTREKDQGKRAGQRELLQQLGVQSPEELQQRLQAAQAVEDAKLSEADRAKRDAEADRAAAAAERAEAARERLTARIERQLISAGVPDQALADVSKLVVVDDGADTEAVKAAVESLRTRLPGLFGQPGSVAPPAPSGAPSGTPPRPQPAGDAYTRGAERARALAAGAGA